MCYFYPLTSERCGSFWQVRTGRVEKNGKLTYINGQIMYAYVKTPITNIQNSQALQLSPIPSDLWRLYFPLTRELYCAPRHPTLRTYLVLPDIGPNSAPCTPEQFGYSYHPHPLSPLLSVPNIFSARRQEPQGDINKFAEIHSSTKESSSSNVKFPCSTVR